MHINDSKSADTGKHPVHETTALSASPVEIKVIVQGLGHGDEITEPKGIESSMTFVPEPVVEETPVMEVPAPGVTDVEEMIVKESTPEVTKELSLTISIPNGVGVPGCDATDECYHDVAQETKEHQTCFKISDSRAKNACMWEIAKEIYSGLSDDQEHQPCNWW